jgi:hypothetical protein
MLEDMSNLDNSKEMNHVVTIDWPDGYGACSYRMRDVFRRNSRRTRNR